MARIPRHTIEDAPPAARPLLAEMSQVSSTGRLLSMRSLTRPEFAAASLTEAFAYLGLTVFTSCFLNYAATELDVPAGPARLGEQVPASPIPGEGA